MNASLINLTYRRLAPLYDALFGAVLQPGRKRSIQALRCQAHRQRILEVGVGTGLSLPLYPDTARVFGIDICPDMLARARQRVETRYLDHVQALLQMDGRHMSFRSNSFDKVVAMYVIPALDDPQPLIAEMRRVCKPDGELIFINHFQTTRPLVRSVQRLLTPLWRWVNYRDDLSIEDFLHDANLEVLEMRHTNLFGYATMIRCRNHRNAELTTEESGELIEDLQY